ncbi:hypothetical protein TSUD_140540 [Trifolium subterraneum]|uniref:Uncharacterized protein n=1 Tax=Trifolium subterraneum TaxID=3900 RepID=A0A2Z6NEV2_TRISU|nr:hypothetical protein TSUD_140540 [Trifolium subterraneum]
MMMVYRLVNLNKDLVRVQGREGITPLHFASQIGDVDLLIRFLIWCPESIEYLTVRRETALHIAIKYKQYEALEVLVGWFKVNDQRDAKKLEKDILNQKDEAGNTILHIAALSSEPQALKLLVKSHLNKKKLLVKTMINLNEKNLDNKTSLDIATTPEIKSILFSVGAKPSLEVIVGPTLARVLIRIVHESIINPRSICGDITEKERSTWLIVATLIATAMYASMLSPLGGVYQISAIAYGIMGMTYFDVCKLLQWDHNVENLSRW